MKIRSHGPDAPVRHTRKLQGFTLIELVVVVTLAMVVLGTVGPRLQQSPSMQVHQVARLMATHLETARTHALAQRVEVEVVFDETPRTYTAYVDHDRNGTIARNDIEAWALQAFGERELEDRVSYGRGSASALPGDVLGSPVTLTGKAFTLDVRGVPEPWGTMGTVYLVHQDDASAVSAVSISAAGSFKAWRWLADEGEWR